MCWIPSHPPPDTASWAPRKSVQSVMPANLPSHDAIDWGIVTIFTIVYVGMFLGGLPRLKLDRSGVALLEPSASLALAP